MKLVSWNMAHREEAWRFLLGGDADVALLQEAVPPPVDAAGRLKVDSSPWETAGAGVYRPWRTAVVGLTDRVAVEHLEATSLPEAPYRGLAVSRPGTLAAALVTPRDGEPFYAVSMYAVWEAPHERTRSEWTFADASVHRLISDLSGLIGQQRGHRIVAAGDLNIYHGYGERGSAYWAGRYETVFARMAALGLPFVGPQAPHGRPADPRPPELPEGCSNVPTYHTNRQTPETASHQLDFVFASPGLAERVRVGALNHLERQRWGPSDHCRVEIELA
jgi:endonuclease/exonuclease/phosphatase family metal-dependent hydrolase